jgi:hypothetical protein
LIYLSIGDVGGQRTLRPYWRNYFEQTDALVWVVDSGDRMRMNDCKEELHSLLLEDVSVFSAYAEIPLDGINIQRLAGASLLVFANKQDLQGSMTDVEIREVSLFILVVSIYYSSKDLEALDLRSIKSHHWKIWSCSAVTGENLVTGRLIPFSLPPVAPPLIFNPFQHNRFGLGSSGRRRATVLFYYGITNTNSCSCGGLISHSSSRYAKRRITSATLPDQEIARA